jgi:hypothetical protein
MTEETVWYVPAEEKREPGTIHVVVFALLIGVGAVAGAFGSLAIPLGYGVTGFWPGVAVQAVGGIWFLRKTSDYIHFIWSAVIVNNFLGALWAVTVLQQFGLITVTSAPLFFSGWVIGNGVPALIFGIILLKALSGFIIRHRSFVKRWVA